MSILVAVLTIGVLVLYCTTASALKQLQAAFASRLVAVSVLVHDMLRLPSGKRWPPWWPKLVAASAPQLPSCRCPAA
ncbi:hypothetical protein PR003_g34804, partial [Phytophthora rubi]